MEINGFYTQKGLALSTKLLTGTPLKITRVAAGSGQTAQAATALTAICQTLAVNTPFSSGDTATIPVTLASAQASRDYTLTELGVYARDPDEGEILYKVYRLETPVQIAAGSSTVLRFYLDETVSQAADITVVCSPAGLITEEMFEPVRKRVESVSAPMKTVSMDITELQAFLDSLPRLLTEFYIIQVTGTLEESSARLWIHDFHGHGGFRIMAETEGDCVIRNQLYISDCTVPVYIWRLRFEAFSGLPINDGLISVSNSRFISLTNSVLLGKDKLAGVRGLHLTYGSVVICEECAVSDFDVAVFVGRGSTATVIGRADSFYDNNIGAYIWYGGILLLGGAVSATLGGASNTKAGGVIAADNGTLL